MSLRTLRLATLVLAIPALAGCTQVDPFNHAGSWRPGGANDRNLQAVLEDPRDLVMGRGASGADGQRAALAVERLRQDRVRPLPASGIARIISPAAPLAPGGGAATAAPAGF
jgi:type IV pilus biogenesis protein CpaD/CtpE